MAFVDAATADAFKDLLPVALEVGARVSDADQLKPYELQLARLYYQRVGSTTHAERRTLTAQIVQTHHFLATEYNNLSRSYFDPATHSFGLGNAHRFAAASYYGGLASEHARFAKQARFLTNAQRAGRVYSLLIDVHKSPAHLAPNAAERLAAVAAPPSRTRALIERSVIRLRRVASVLGC